MAKKRNFEVNDVAIVDLGAKGKAVGKKDGLVYFVAGAVPGDVCDVLVRRKKKGFFEADIMRTTTLSPNRVEPQCAHFGVCGGCKWQNMAYQAQLQFKANYVANNIKKIGGVVPETTEPILGNKEPYYYRNKLEFGFTDNRWLTKEEVESNKQMETRNGIGFHIPGFWDKILDIDHCHLQPEPSNAIRNWFRNYALENGLSFFNLREKTGLLRGLLIRTATTGQVMVLVQFGEEDESTITTTLNALNAAFPQVITSLQYVINTKQNDTIYDLETVVFSGEPFIIEEMPAYYAGEKPLHFRIGPKSFYQTNSNQAYNLYKIALDYADLKGGETVYDLYTGTGTIALFLAQKATKVVGIEAVKEAIDDALLNASANNITNATFEVGDMKDAFSESFINKHGKPDVVVTDPPRDGMHAKVVEQLLNLAAPRIVYVSCNPATQARDIALLKEKYNVVKSRAVDMFPQTHHIENVALLELK